VSGGGGAYGRNGGYEDRGVKVFVLERAEAQADARGAEDDGQDLERRLGEFPGPVWFGLRRLKDLLREGDWGIGDCVAGVVDEGLEAGGGVDWLRRLRSGLRCCCCCSLGGWGRLSLLLRGGRGGSHCGCRFVWLRLDSGLLRFRRVVVRTCQDSDV
jgi:hypothetical protein